MGKLEPLKCGLAGAWSSRITDEHRLIYRITKRATTTERRIGDHVPSLWSGRPPARRSAVARHQSEQD
ncbi:MAG: type II toxin-antitoxin system YoeB family toxin [Mycolicibacterium sp.]|nr:type II toxin-antitoxin system YoeB family toxin [Mycolicibacterium sp.]